MQSLCVAMKFEVLWCAAAKKFENPLRNKYWSNKTTMLEIRV